MLVQEGIIDNDTVDLNALGVSALQNAATLFGAIVASLESNPVKFPKLIEVFKSFTTLTTVADELEEAGRLDIFSNYHFKTMYGGLSNFHVVKFLKSKFSCRDLL